VPLQSDDRPLQRLHEPLTGDAGMIRVEVVLLQQSERHLIEESLVGMPITTTRVRAARPTEAYVCIGILLTMQGSTDRDQSPGMFLRIVTAVRYFGKPIRDDLSDVGGNPA